MSDQSPSVEVIDILSTAKKPVYSTVGAAGADLYAIADFVVMSIPNIAIVLICVVIIHLLGSYYIECYYLCFLFAYIINAWDLWLIKYFPYPLAIYLGIILATIWDWDVSKSMIVASVACESYIIIRGRDNLITSTICTGIKLKIAHGFYGSIRDRSSMAIKGISVVGGVIDSDYTGEVKVLLRNFGLSHYQIKKGDKVAQLIISKFEQCKTFVPDQATERKDGDTGGFGSTGT